MLSPSRTWIAVGLLYTAFFLWYTSFGAPLSEAEIEEYVELLHETGTPPERIAVFREFMEGDTGDDFAMLNAIEMRDAPLEVEGVAPGASSQEVLARYTGPFLAEALRSAAHPVMFGRAAAGALDIWGVDGAERWSNGGLVRYRSRRDLMEQVRFMADRGDRIHRFKVAAMAKTVAFPVDPWFHLGDPRLVLGLLLAALGLAAHLCFALARLRRARAPA
ncbi:MAG: hypothetical protein ACQGVK_06295 [Myxococcota bacterium]